MRKKGCLFALFVILIIFTVFFGAAKTAHAAASGDCSLIMAGKTYIGKNNTLGYTIGKAYTSDTKFLCYNSKFYECGWSSSNPSVVDAADKQITGSWKCNLTQKTWLAYSQPTTPPTDKVASATASCSVIIGGKTYAGINNTLGYKIGTTPYSDTKFLCYNSKFYECGWSSTNANIVDAADKQIVGSWKCNLTQKQWVAYSAGGVKPLNVPDITSCREIALSGTYTFTQDITANPGSCIVIKANDVIIDFNGKKLTGSDIVNSYGVDIGAYKRIVVKNGFITGYAFGSAAISLQSSENVEINGMTTSSNNNGIVVSGGINNVFLNNNINDNLKIYSSSSNTIVGGSMNQLIISYGSNNMLVGISPNSYNFDNALLVFKKPDTMDIRLIYKSPITDLGSEALNNIIKFTGSNSIEVNSALKPNFNKPATLQFADNLPESVRYKLRIMKDGVVITPKPNIITYTPLTFDVSGFSTISWDMNGAVCGDDNLDPNEICDFGPDAANPNYCTDMSKCCQKACIEELTPPAPVNPPYPQYDSYISVDSSSHLAGPCINAIDSKIGRQRGTDAVIPEYRDIKKEHYDNVLSNPNDPYDLMNAARFLHECAKYQGYSHEVTSAETSNKFDLLDKKCICYKDDSVCIKRDTTNTGTFETKETLYTWSDTPFNDQCSSNGMDYFAYRYSCRDDNNDNCGYTECNQEDVILNKDTCAGDQSCIITPYYGAVCAKCGNGRLETGEQCDPDGGFQYNGYTYYWPDFDSAHCYSPGEPSECQCIAPYVSDGQGNCIEIRPGKCEITKPLILITNPTASSAGLTCNADFSYTGETPIPPVTPGQPPSPVTLKVSVKITLQTPDGTPVVTPYTYTINPSSTVESLNHLFPSTLLPTSPILECKFEATGQFLLNGGDIGDPFTCTESKVSLKDIDKDGVDSAAQIGISAPLTIVDCDDWPFNDPAPCFGTDYDKIYKLNIQGRTADFKTKFCNQGTYRLPEIYGDVDMEGDANNDGIGEQASCSYCRNPNMPEECDNIDNNCLGTCQGKTNVPCFIPDPYDGDGAADIVDEDLSGYQGDGSGGIGVGSCQRDVPVNPYGVKDNFCQMQDENIAVGATPWTTKETGITCDAFETNCFENKCQLKYCNDDPACEASFLDSCITSTEGAGSICDCSIRFNYPSCNGYNRCVKWTEWKRDTDSVAPLVVPAGQYCPPNQAYCENYYKVTYGSYTFKSGQAGTLKGDNTDCSFKSVTELVTCGNNPSSPNINIPEPPFGCLYSVVLKEEPQPDCGPSSEAVGNTRNTVYSFQNPSGQLIQSTQMIDSMRGECNFGCFWTAAAAHSGVSGGILRRDKFTWHTSCVPKDKCSDGVDNDQKKNFFEMNPYKFYLPEPSKTSLDPELNIPDTILQGEKFYYPMNFVDVDDEVCKFQNPSTIAATINPSNGILDPLHPYYLPNHGSIFNYKLNPVKNAEYCRDLDGDAFCGYEVDSFDQPPHNPNDADNYVCVKYGRLLGIPGLPVCKEKVYKTQPKKGSYSISKQFPDCVDDPAYQFKEPDIRTSIGMPGTPPSLLPLMMSRSLGWNDFYTDKPFTAWNVHPLAPVLKGTCQLGKYDFNCNKNIPEGLAYNLLNTGKTPFDTNLATGIEVFSNDLKYTYRGFKENEVVGPEDGYCVQELPYDQFVLTESFKVVKFTAIMVGTTLVAQAALPATLARLAGMVLTTWAVVGTSVQAVQIADTFVKLSDGTITWDKAKRDLTSLTLNNIPYISTVGATKLKAIIRFSKSTKRIILEQDPVQTRGQNAQVGTSDDVVWGVTKEGNQEPPPRVGQAGCFLENTSIMLDNGSYKDIEDIKVDDKVLAYDIYNNIPVNATVSATFVRNETKYRIIEYEVIS